MAFLKRALAVSFATALLAGTAIVGPLPAGWTTNAGGNAGTLGPDGVVTSPPSFGPNYIYISTAGTPDDGPGGPDGVVTSPPCFGPNYIYISTAGTPDDGPGGPASLGIGSETNGTFLESPSFFANAGSLLSFYFNYVTSDGSIYVEYAWAALAAAGNSDILFTARTTTSGDTVPGSGLPGLAPGVTLTPASTAIIPGGPLWSPLEGSSGTCFAGGCGYTGWVEMQYTIPTAGTYTLQFGVVNWLDTAFDTGMAIAGATIDDKPIGVPEPASLALLGAGLLGLAAARRRRRSGRG